MVFNYQQRTLSCIGTHTYIHAHKYMITHWETVEQELRLNVQNEHQRQPIPHIYFEREKNKQVTSIFWLWQPYTGCNNVLAVFAFGTTQIHMQQALVRPAQHRRMNVQPLSNILNIYAHTWDHSMAERTISFVPNVISNFRFLKMRQNYTALKSLKSLY